MVRIRKLREKRTDAAYWKQSTPEQRLKAVEIINCLAEDRYAQQAFPRVYRITRKPKS